MPSFHDIFRDTDSKGELPENSELLRQLKSQLGIQENAFTHSDIADFCSAAEEAPKSMEEPLHALTALLYLLKIRIEDEKPFFHSNIIHLLIKCYQTHYAVLQKNQREMLDAAVISYCRDQPATEALEQKEASTDLTPVNLRTAYQALDERESQLHPNDRVFFLLQTIYPQAGFRKRNYRTQLYVPFDRDGKNDLDYRHIAATTVVSDQKTIHFQDCVEKVIVSPQNLEARVVNPTRYRELAQNLTISSDAKQDAKGIATFIAVELHSNNRPIQDEITTAVCNNAEPCGLKLFNAASGEIVIDAKDCSAAITNRRIYGDLTAYRRAEEKSLRGRGRTVGAARDINTIQRAVSEQKRTNTYDTIETIHYHPVHDGNGRLIAFQIIVDTEITASGLRKGITVEQVARFINFPGWKLTEVQLKDISKLKAGVANMFICAERTNNLSEAYKCLADISLSHVEAEIAKFNQHLIDKIALLIGLGLQLNDEFRNYLSLLKTSAVQFTALKNAQQVLKDARPSTVSQAQTFTTCLDALETTIAEIRRLDNSWCQRCQQQTYPVEEVQHHQQWLNNPQNILPHSWHAPQRLVELQNTQTQLQAELTAAQNDQFTQLITRVGQYTPQTIAANKLWVRTHGGTNFSAFILSTDYDALQEQERQNRPGVPFRRNVLANLRNSPHYAYFTSEQKDELFDFSLERENQAPCFLNHPLRQEKKTAREQYKNLIGLLNNFSPCDSLDQIVYQCYRDHYRYLTVKQKENLNDYVLGRNQNGVGLHALIVANKLWESTQQGTNWNNAGSFEDAFSALKIWNKQNRLPLPILEKFLRARYANLSQAQQKQLLKWITDDANGLGEQSNSILQIISNIKNAHSSWRTNFAENFHRLGWVGKIVAGIGCFVAGASAFYLGNKNVDYVSPFNQMNLETGSVYNYDALLFGSEDVTPDNTPETGNNNNGPQTISRGLVDDILLGQALAVVNQHRRRNDVLTHEQVQPAPVRPQSVTPIATATTPTAAAANDDASYTGLQASSDEKKAEQAEETARRAENNISPSPSPTTSPTILPTIGSPPKQLSLPPEPELSALILSR